MTVCHNAHELNIGFQRFFVGLCRPLHLYRTTKSKQILDQSGAPPNQFLKRYPHRILNAIWSCSGTQHYHHIDFPERICGTEKKILGQLSPCIYQTKNNLHWINTFPAERRRQYWKYISAPNLYLPSTQKAQYQVFTSHYHLVNLEEYDLYQGLLGEEIVIGWKVQLWPWFL